MIDNSVLQATKRHEGKRLKMYMDNVGVETIGYGHNLKDRSISDEAAELILSDDLEIAQREVGHFKWFAEQNSVRRNVLIMMCFNLGLFRLLKFRRMIGALSIHNHDSAADEMLDSRWASQVHGRADELAAMMRSGEWAE